MPHRRARRHNFRRPPLAPPIILSIQRARIFPRRPMHQKLSRLGEHTLQPWGMTNQPVEPDKRNLEQLRRIRKIAAKMDRGRSLVGVELERGRTLQPGIMGERDKLLIVRRVAMGINQSQIWLVHLPIITHSKIR